MADESRYLNMETELLEVERLMKVLIRMFDIERT